MTHLNDVVYSIIIGVTNVHPNGGQSEAIALASSLHSDGTGHHGVSGAAHRATLSYTTAGRTVVKT